MHETIIAWLCADRGAYRNSNYEILYGAFDLFIIFIIFSERMIILWTADAQLSRKCRRKKESISNVGGCDWERNLFCSWKTNHHSWISLTFHLWLTTFVFKVYILSLVGNGMNPIYLFNIKKWDIQTPNICDIYEIMNLDNKWIMNLDNKVHAS